eukprot:s2709_g4.t1
MAKEEPEDCISASFQSRLTEWGEQCLRFQASGEQWGPTKPCCPANPFLGLEGLEVWQGLKKDEAKACVELLSIEELLELHRVFLETVTLEPQPAPGVVSALPNLQLRPWAGSPEVSAEQKPSEVEPISAKRTRPGQGVKKAAKAKTKKLQLKPKATAKPSGLKQSPSPSKASGPAGTEVVIEPRASAPTKAQKVQRKPGKVTGVSYYKQGRCWRVLLHVPLTRTKKFGGYFAVKKDAEAKAQELSKELQPLPMPSKASGSAVTERHPDSPSTKKRMNEAAKAKKLKRKSGSDVKGVYYYNNSWVVRVYDSATQKTTYGGRFKFKGEAEARAKQRAKNAGVAWRKR